MNGLYLWLHSQRKCKLCQMQIVANANCALPTQMQTPNANAIIIIVFDRVLTQHNLTK